MTRSNGFHRNKREELAALAAQREGHRSMRIVQASQLYAGQQLINVRMLRSIPASVPRLNNRPIGVGVVIALETNFANGLIADGFAIAV